MVYTIHNKWKNLLADARAQLDAKRELRRAAVRKAAVLDAPLAAAENMARHLANEGQSAE